MLKTFFYFTLYTLLFASFTVQSSTKNEPDLPAASKVDKKQISKYKNFLDDFDSKGLLQLSALKGQISSKDIKDGQRLVKAMEHIEKENHKAAHDLLKKISRNTLLKDYIKYYRALALIQQKKYNAALKDLPPIKNPNKKIALESFWLRQEALMMDGQTQVSEAEIKALKKYRPKDKWVDIKGSYYKGLGAFHHGDKSYAYKQFQDVVVKNPGSLYDKKIFDLTKTQIAKSNRLLSESLWNLRAEKLIATGFPHEGLRIWKAFYKKRKSYEERVAYGTFRSRDYKTAAALYEKLLKNGNHSISKVQIMDKIAKAYSRHDNFEKALEFYGRIVKEYPKSRQAFNANFKLGFIYFDSEQYKKAIKYFEKFLTKGSSWQRDRARWFRLWSFYLTKKYNKALQEIESLEKKTRAKKSERVMLAYWKGRIAQKQGHKKEARALFQKVAQMDGLDYYGLLARHRMTRKKLHPRTLIHPSTLSMVPSGKSKSTIDLPNIKSLDRKDPLTKAILLSQIGLDNFAFDESKHSIYAKSVPNFDQAKAIEKAGNFYRGFATRRSAINGGMSGANKLDGFRLGFPLAYEKFVKPYSELWGLDDKLAYSIMRQESAFKPEALSYAYAYGLMQIIPPTGDEIAQNINYENFDVSELNNPRINTLFGTYYLKYLLKEFDDELVFAIAGYNAGPHAVKRWKVKANSMEMDEFIELIPYKETNKYVKKVLVNYLVYNKIYP